ncbi:hypothetical protein EYC84_009910 [Monilinia fructicola]|uniref:Uncharacterized protein n=1 Tax=Monilinia fructicola TaxID=38448 RepID=A0A5M9JC15_MONFR|nr:hypothetical protein EYC84_009910 [Monilinia fructicola]
MASSSFRDSMNSLGWSRRDPDLPINTAQQTGGLLSSIKSLNPFGDSGYVRLPTTEGAGAPLPGRNRREEEEGWFALSRWDRLLLFAGFNIGALACFVICFALFSVLDCSSNQVCDSMDSRFNAIPRIMGRDDGPVDPGASK